MDPIPTPSEFLFGRLSTPEGRARHAREAHTGLRHAELLDPSDPVPDQPVRVTVQVGTDLDVSAVVLAYTTDDRRPNPPRVEQGPGLVPFTRTGAAWSTLAWGYVEDWTAVLPGQPDGTLVRYAVAARGRDGTWRDAPRTYAYHVDRLAVPTWLRDAVLYHVVVDRFAPDPGQDFLPGRTVHQPHGGTLRGLTSRLDDLADLGVTCLWLTPITPCPSYHGYDPTDLATVEPRLGTEADWDALARAAKDRGLRLLLDFVANHVSDRHPAFLQARADPNSPYVPWFRFTAWPDEYRGFFALKSMPVLDTDHPGPRGYLIDSAVRWLDRGCDGFRLDHAHGPGPAFWSEFRARTRQARPDAALLGEITDPPDALRAYAGRMDGVLDFALADALRGLFAHRRLGVTAFAAWLDRHFRYFGDDLVLASFLDNHDMSRFLWLTGGDPRPLRLAALCQFTLPGPPVVYYGTEVGLTQARPLETLDESRLPMPWNGRQDLGLRAFYRDLVRLRLHDPAGWRDGPRLLWLDEARGLLSYEAGDNVVVLNTGDAEADLPPGRPRQVVLSTDPAARVRHGRLALPPRTGVVLG